MYNDFLKILILLGITSFSKSSESLFASDKSPNLVSQTHGVLAVLCVMSSRPVHHDNDIKEVVVSQPSITWYKSGNQKIGICTVWES